MDRPTGWADNEKNDGCFPPLVPPAEEGVVTPHPSHNLSSQERNLSAGVTLITCTRVEEIKRRLAFVTVNGVIMLGHFHHNMMNELLKYGHPSNTHHPFHYATNFIPRTSRVT